MNKVRKIMLTTDFTEAARKAYPVAAQLAQKFGAKILLVHFKNKKAPEFSGITNEDHLRDILQALKDESRRDEFNGIHVVVKRLDRNIPVSLPLFEDEYKCDLVLTAIRRRKGIRHFVLSDVGNDVLATSSVPVLVYANSQQSNAIFDVRRVLIAVTSSAGIRDALPTVLFLKQNFDCAFRFLLVTPKFDEQNWLSRWIKSNRGVRQSAEVAFDQLMQGPLKGVEAELVCATGIPANVIAESANTTDIDLVAIGPRGFKKGICKRVIYQANCSVLKMVEERINED